MQDLKQLGRPKTPAELTAKWKPVLEGIVEPARTRVAWLMESEAKFLQSIEDKIRETQVGPALKYVFPALRWAGPALVMNKDISVEEIYYALDGAYMDYTDPGKTPLLKLAERTFDEAPADPTAPIDWFAVAARGSFAFWRANLPGLAARVHQSIQTLPI